MSDRRYLKRRGEKWWVQIAVPADVRIAYGRAVVQRTLGTSDVRAAQRLRWEHLAEAEQTFARLRGKATLTSAEIERIADTLFRNILERAAAARREGRTMFRADPEVAPGDAPRDNVSDNDAEIAALELLEGDYGDTLRDGDLVKVGAEARALAAERGFIVTDDTLKDDDQRRAFNELSGAILRARYEAYRARLAYLRGDSYTPPASFSRGVIDPVTLQPRDKPQRQRLGKSPLLSAITPRYVGIMSKEAWTEKTRQQSEGTFRLLTTYLGDQPIGAITKADVRSFREDVLEKLPVNYGKSRADRDAPLSAITSRPGARLNQKTIKRHIAALRGLFDWAEGEGHREKDDNAAAGFRFKNTKRAREERPAWTDAELKTLFASPVWRGCQSKVRRKEPGALVIRDGMFWIPLISLFSGLRLEEAAALRPADVRDFQDVPCFDVKPGDGKGVKSPAGARVVPVHSALIGLGLLDHVAVAMKRNDPRIFPELKAGGPDSRFGAYLTKKFGDYRRHVDLSRPGVGLHSLRSNFTTALQNAGVPEHIAAELVGHASGTMTYGRYGKGVDVLQLRAAVERVSFPSVDLSKLAAAACRPSRLRQVRRKGTISV